MKRRVIIWTAMGVALAAAPLAAEARGGRGTRRFVLGCGESACVASTAVPTTTAALLTDLTDLTTAPSVTDDTSATSSSSETSDASTITEATLPADASTDPTSSASSDATSPSVPSGTGASTTSDATTEATTTPSGATTAETSASTTEATLPATEPTPAPTPAPEPSVDPTPAPTEPSVPPTPPTSVTPPPAGGSFLMSTANPHVGVPVTFDVGDLTCDPAEACSYTWQWFYRSAGGTVLTGGQIGRGTTVTYTFDDFAASKPAVFVTLTVSQGRLGIRHTYTSTFAVTP